MALMRSLLIVPAGQTALLETAAHSTADVVVVDLAGSATPDRVSLEGAFAALKTADKQVFLRLNPLDSDRSRDELAAAIGPGLDGLILPAVEIPAQIRELDVLIRQQEVHNQVRPGTITLVPQIDSPRGLLRLDDIILASTRISALALGTEGYLSALGVRRSSGGRELEFARGLLVTHCVAFGLQALDGAYPADAEPAGLVRETEYAVTLGFRGKYAASAAQAETINHIFSAEG